MQIEYIADESPDCPLLRIFDFDPAELRPLFDAFGDLAAERIDAFDLRGVAPVDPLDDVSLRCTVAGRDEGLVGRFPDFELRLTPLRWDEVQELAEPFLRHSPGMYQWLSEEGAAALLLSPTGEW